MRVLDAGLHGRTVIAADGQAVGTVAALLVDSTTWRVEALRVELRREVADRLGSSRRLFRTATSDIPTHIVQSVGDAVVLSVSLDGLRQALPGEGLEATAQH